MLRHPEDQAQILQHSCAIRARALRTERAELRAVIRPQFALPQSTTVAEASASRLQRHGA
jgi:hypothetical protein